MARGSAWVAVAVAVGWVFGQTVPGALAAHRPRIDPFCVTPASAAAGVQWAFHASAKSPHAGSAVSSLINGHGSALVGSPSSRLNGTICHEDQFTVTHKQHLTLTPVSGRGASLDRQAHSGGFLGAVLIMPVRVSRSDDSGCKVGTRGRLTLFNSYNGVHADAVSLSFSGGCADHVHSYRDGHGASVVVSIPH